MLRKVYDSLLTLAYPEACKICKCSIEISANGLACEECWRKTLLFDGTETTCEKCGKLHQRKSVVSETHCRECNEHFYDQARAAGVYEYALSATILNLKKKPFIHMRMRAVILDSFSGTPFQDVNLIVPAPLAKKRLLERGFNQAEIIARLISNENGIPIDNQALKRTKHAKVHRAGMDRRGRELSVEKSFQYAKSGQLQGDKILLIDDVFASGATASACAKILKKNGASKVYVFTIARAV